MRRPAPLSFRLKVILTYAASTLCGVFLVFAAGSYYVNSLQRRNVESAVALAYEQARELARYYLELMPGESETDILRMRTSEKLLARTEVVLRKNNNVVWAGIFDASGNRIVERSSSDEQSFVAQGGEEGKYSTEIPVSGRDKMEVTIKSEPQNATPIRAPILKEGRQLGEVRLRVADNPMFQRIEATSNQITVALLGGCILLLAFLVVVYWVLWRLFSRQLKLAEKAAQLDRMAYVGTLASGLAHEIRNPLSAMSVNLQVIGEELRESDNGEGSRACDLTRRVQDEVRQLNSVLTGFLNFALPDKDRLTEFSLRSLLEELIELHSEQMKQSGISCELTAPSRSATLIEADRRLVYQAFQNILVNAIQALGGSVKKSIRIVVEPAPGMLRTVISDTGPGIPEGNLDRVFDIFFTTRAGGSGFGLAVTRRIVEDHRGRIQVTNNTDSMGASFVVDLPREISDSGNRVTIG